MLFQFVAKGERGHPTWIYTWVYRVLNMHSDCHTNEPGSIVWQSEHTLICSDGTSSHCPPLREVHPCASCTYVFLAHPPTVLLPSRVPAHTHTSKCFTHRGPLTQGSTYLGVPHTAARSSEAVL